MDHNRAELEVTSTSSTGGAPIASYLQLSRKQVHHLHDKGDLTTVKVGAKTINSARGLA
jgi:hypothetical protein